MPIDTKATLEFGVIQKNTMFASTNTKHKTMGQLFQKWASKPQLIDKIGPWFKSLPTKAAGLYKKTVLNPQIEMNKELAQYQFDKNLEMWNIQNEYNSPSAQRARMEAAGFNPNFIAGGGASGTGSASPASMPQYNVNAPTVDPMAFYGRIVQAAQGLMNIRRQAADVRKIESQTGKLGIESQQLTSLYPYRETGLALANQGQLNKNSLMGQMLDYRHLYNRKQLTAMDATIDNLRARTIYNRYQNELAKYGIFSSSSPWLNMSIKALEAAGVDPLNWIKTGSQGLMDYMRSK